MTDSSLSLACQTAQQLREDIIAGRLRPRMSLVEAELTARYGVSRNTVREALHQLQREGLTVYVRNRGVMVRELGAADIRDIFIVRRTLELQAVQSGRPLHYLQADQMQTALAAAAAAETAGDWSALGTCSLRFHQQIVSVLGSRQLDDFFSTITAQLRLLFSVAPSEEIFQRPWLERDLHIFSLLEQARWRDASTAMQTYLDDSERNLLTLTGPQQ